MTEVSQQFMDRWRSGKHVGAATPAQIVLVRRGEFVRDRQPFIGLDGSEEDWATFPRGLDSAPWHATWVPRGDYKWLPGVSEVSLSQNFDNNGIQSCTITCANLIYQAVAGVVGTYHIAKRGILSPYMGFAMPGRGLPSWSEITEWYNVLQGGQVSVGQGYGSDTAVTPFTGLIDDIDMSSSPDTMTITARDFSGSTLGEQRLYGYVKDPKLHPPITFADRLHSDDLEKVGSAARASSYDRRYPPVNVLKAPKLEWWSQSRNGPNVTEWVEIRLPRGRYESFHVYPKFAGMEMWLSVYVKDRIKDTKTGQVNDVNVEEGWVDLGGNGEVVPGANGGFPFVKHWDSVDNNASHKKMGAKFEVGANSILRVSFRRLHKHAPGDYRAAVKRLLAYSRKQKDEAKTNKWILVDDASGIVKTALMWAGFHEWEVEDFGARLKKPVVFHQSNFLIDLIRYCTDQGNFQFFMDGPTSHNLSIGVPVFRRQHATDPFPGNGIEIRDTDVLTGIQVKATRTPRATIIRARGAEASKKEGGTILGEDTTRRITASYTPPWTKAGDMAGIIKHVTHFDRLLETEIECKMMCVLIAIQQCLQSNTAQFEVPGNPAIGLDTQVALVDEGTGVNSRIWVASRESTFTFGEQSKWTSTIGGSLIDTPYMLGIALDYVMTLVEWKEQQDQARSS